MIIYVLFWVWQLPQNVLGWLLSARHRNRHIGPAGFKYIHSDGWIPCMCLGEYLFIGPSSLVRFAYGRGVLSVIFGPLYLPFISLPAIFVSLFGRYYYMAHYSTRWALKIGKRKPY